MWIFKVLRERWLQNMKRRHKCDQNTPMTWHDLWIESSILQVLVYQPPRTFSEIDGTPNCVYNFWVVTMFCCIQQSFIFSFRYYTVYSDDQSVREARSQRCQTQRRTPFNCHASDGSTRTKSWSCCFVTFDGWVTSVMVKSQSGNTIPILRQHNLWWSIHLQVPMLPISFNRNKLCICNGIAVVMMISFYGDVTQ